MSMSDERKTQDRRQREESVGGSSPAGASMPLDTSGPHAARSDSDIDAQRRAKSPAGPEGETPSGVYFFPGAKVTRSEVRALLASERAEDRASVVSHLLTYAEYDEIWTWVDRDTVCDLFESLDLPERLRAAWARNLGLVTEPR